MSEPTPALDREARRRLAMPRHVEEVTGNVAMTCRYFGISRQAYYGPGGEHPCRYVHGCHLLVLRHGLRKLAVVVAVRQQVLRRTPGAGPTSVIWRQTGPCGHYFGCVGSGMVTPSRQR
jgi:hypothetical protein